MNSVSNFGYFVSLISSLNKMQDKTICYKYSLFLELEVFTFRIPAIQTKEVFTADKV